MGHSHVVEDAGHDRVGDGFDRGGAIVVVRVGGNEQHAGLNEEFEVLHVHQRDRGLARHKDELAAFFEHHVGAPQHGIGTQSVCDAS